MCRIAPAAACRRWSRRPGAGRPRPTRRPASASSSRCSTPARRRSTPTSTAPRPSCWACRSPRLRHAVDVYMGSAYVNDFNYLGRTYRVTAQADNPFRATCATSPTSRRATTAATWCRSARSRPSATPPAPIACRATTSIRPPRCRGLGPGLLHRPGDRRDGAARERSPARRLRLRMDRDRLPGEARGQHRRDRLRPGVVFVFLLLAAQYESWLLPLAVILIVPMCLLAAIIGVLFRGLDNNILTADRLRGAGRPGGEERDPDRRVREAGRGRGR